MKHNHAAEEYYGAWEAQRSVKPPETFKRPDAPQPSGAPHDVRVEAGEARTIRNLEELRRLHADTWRKEVAMRRLDRILATEPMGSPIYSQALSEWHRARQED